ncbi:MAG: hypothetical protein WDO68_23445 [Gammaproteobacteria bacterium]
MNLKAFATASIVLTLTACSSQPREPAGRVPAPAAPLSAAPAAKLAPATPAATPAAAGASAPTASGETPVLNRTLISAGYKPTTIKGEVYYCRMEDVTNTAFKRKVCLNEAQLREEERKIKQMQDQMMRTQASPSCMGPSCG